MPHFAPGILSVLLVGWCGSDPQAPEVTVVEHAVAAAIPKAAGDPATAATPAATVATETATPTPTPSVERDLGVQVALRTARERLAAGAAGEAVIALEERLKDAAGAAEYLDLLASAYRQELGRLVRENKTDEAAAVERRLRLLGQSTTPANLAATPTAAPKPLPTPNPPKAKPTAKGLPGANWLQFALGVSKNDKTDEPKTAPAVARAKWDHQAEESAANPAQNDLVRADECWMARDFAKALSHYQAAYRTDPAGKVQEARDRFGYCLLVVAFEKYERTTADGACTESDACWEAWETAVRQGRDLVRIASYRKFADEQLAMLTERRAATKQPRTVETASPATRPKTDAANVSSYRHLPQEYPGGWKITETKNFRIMHRDVALAEEVAGIAETSRRQASELWFASEPLQDWSTNKCDLVLYPTAQEFAQHTRQMPESPAFTQCDVRPGWVASRRIELRADEPKMKSAILPHEVAHAVFAGRFAGQSPPKWADEGMAVLTEPVSIQEMHLANLVRSRSAGRGFNCQRLLTLKQYPPEVQDFYAHSVGVCRLLVEQHGGREKLVQYIRLATETNDPDSALFRVYGIRGLASLESLFVDFVGECQRNAVAAN